MTYLARHVKQGTSQATTYEDRGAYPKRLSNKVDDPDTIHTQMLDKAKSQTPCQHENLK